MKHRQIFLFFLIAAILPTNAFAQTLNYTDEVFELDSEILGEKRAGRIFMPSDINTDEPVPVIYVLDGEWNHELVSSMVGFFRRWNRIPDMAVVSLNNSNRTRDFTPTEDDARYPGSGGASGFLRFVEDEFIPYIENNYPISDERLLFGHSFGGLYALYTLKKSPELFSGYISVSPSVWWKDRYMFSEYPLESLNQKPFVYMTAGTNDRGNTQAMAEFSEYLDETGYSRFLELYTDIHEEENHFTNVSITLHEALKKLFPESRFAEEAVTAWQENGAGGIQQWYEESRSNFGFRFRMPSDALRTFGYNLHARDQKTNEALELLEWLASVDGDDYQVFYFLGAIAKEAGRTELAIQNYRKALEVGNMPSRMETVIERSLNELEEEGS